MAMTFRSTRLSRREVLQAAALAGAGALVPRAFAAQSGAQNLPLITRPIPASGERLPVIGLGTNAYSVTSAQDLAARKEVLSRLPELGGSVIDTAPGYGRSEEVIGQLVAELGNRGKLFLATKVTAANDDAALGKAMLEESFKRLRTDRLDLVEVHNLMGTEALLPVLAEYKAAKRIRYLGVTTSNDAQHAATADILRRHKLDFVQVNYSIDDRESAQTLLPLAQERGAAVLVNMPFGGRRGGNLFTRVKDRPLPEWAAELDASSWSQFFLKYVVSHPAVTCAIPGTTKLSHLEDNQRGGRGRLPDATLRKRMDAYWAELPS
jgi:aryl-alcohol dehydrogenase-like predicted oxidoreductase